MINIGKKTKKTPEEIVEKAVDYFGPDGLGLNITERSRCCANFDGGGGFVQVQVIESEGEDKSDVKVMGREYDYQIKAFIKKL